MRLPVGGGIQRVDAAGADQGNISLLKNNGLAAALHGVDIFRGHNDLHCCMPVRGIVLIFIIVVQLDGCTLFVIDGFKNAV